MQVMGVHAVSLAVDQIPINPYEPEAGGVPSAIANAQVWNVAFDTNGILPPKKIVAAACDNIIGRVNNLRELLYNINSSGDEYILIVDGESDTIGNLIMRTTCELYPDINAVTYSTAHIGRALTIRMRCDEDINIIYNTVIAYLDKTFKTIKSYFE
jgi:DNA-directed RNA polymerase subunit L